MRGRIVSRPETVLHWEKERGVYGMEDHVGHGIYRGVGTLDWNAARFHGSADPETRWCG